MNANLDLFSLALLALAASVPLGIWISFFLQIRLVPAMLLSIGTNVIVMCWLAMNISHNRPLVDLDSAEPILRIAAVFPAVDLGLALLIKLYHAAVLDKATIAERSTGVAGMRAWLSILNVSTVVLFAIGASLGFDFDFFGLFILGLCALLAYPLINTLLQNSPQSPAPPQAPAEERQRVLALVEAGKITAEEAAELLSALAQSQTSGVDAPTVITGPRRVMLLGAAIVMLGFFLPWFTLNVSQQMRDTMSDMQNSFSQMPAMPPQFSGLPQAADTQQSLKITLRGGDVRNGLGWIMLLAALCPAGLPFFWAPHRSNSQQQRNVIFTALIIGSVALLYLLTNSFNAITSIEYGFVFVMAGYVALWFGAIRNEALRNPKFEAAPPVAFSHPSSVAADSRPIS